MISRSRLSSVVGKLVFVSGQGGFGKILVPGRMLGFGLISFLPRIRLLRLLGFLVEPHLIDAEFRKAWMPFFCRSGHPVVTTDQLLAFVGHRNLSWIFLASRVGTCRRLLGLKCLVWLLSWNWLRPLVSGHRVFWMPVLP